MSRLEDLSPDLHAVLSLLLARRKGYGEIAAMLGIEERAVHDRAHAALALLAPRQARALSAAEREQVGEYLLGQADPAQRSAARAHLEGSAAAAAWAQALAAELAPLASEPLPAIPADAEPTPVAKAPISRRGGAIVLGALAAIAIVAVVLIVTLSGGSGGAANPSASSGGGPGTSSATTPSAPASTTGSTTSTAGGSSSVAPAGSSSGASTGTTTSGPQPKYGKPIVLSAPASAPSAAKGVAFVITLSGKHAFYTFIKGLPPAGGGGLYAVWLENSPTEAIPLGSLAAPKSNGLVEGGGSLPSNAGSFARIAITRETSRHPTHPSQAVLSGSFTLG
ncbi:MAG: hypothetical protein ACHQE6_10930 [Solirubrobacterales bacterium]